MDPTRDEIAQWFRDLQTEICNQIAAADGIGQFATDTWDRPGGGGGRSRVLTDGAIIEKGGVNFSAVWGKTPTATVQLLGLTPGDGAPDFFATGVSIVMHPRSPRVPIIHMNVRYFELSNGSWWFGGGIDLTPHYVDIDDTQYFHQQLKTICDQHDRGLYPKFKRWADEYFYLKHRQETRGVGGIFFDHLQGNNDFSKASRFDFVKDVGRAFSPIYVHLIKKNSDLPYGEREKHWQALRRGRYVEFNLVWDRGTRFGLDTDGRTESVLMSLPPTAQWIYNHIPEAGSEEEKTLSYLKQGIDWA